MRKWQLVENLKESDESKLSCTNESRKMNFTWMMMMMAQLK
jgi:hypothetical protein